MTGGRSTRLNYPADRLSYTTEPAILFHIKVLPAPGSVARAASFSAPEFDGLPPHERLRAGLLHCRPAPDLGALTLSDILRESLASLGAPAGGLRRRLAEAAGALGLPAGFAARPLSSYDGRERCLAELLQAALLPWKVCVLERVLEPLDAPLREKARALLAPRLAQGGAIVILGEPW